MATVIDSLVIQLGLDPKNLTKGQADAIASFKRSQEQMLSTAKSIEEGARRVTEVLHKLRNEAIAFTAALVGAAGIKEFFANIIKTDADLGRLARSLGLSVEELSTWRSAIKLSGGSAADADVALGGLVQQFQLMKIDPTQATGLLRYLRALQVNIDDIDISKPGELSKLIFRIAKAGEGKNIAQISTFFSQMGFSPGFINALTQGEAGLRRYLAEAQKLGPTTREDAEAARKFELAWERLSTSLTRFGHNMVTVWGPKIADMLDWLTSRAERFATIMIGVIGGGAIGSIVPGVGTLGGALIGGTAAAVYGNATMGGSKVSGAPVKPGAVGGGPLTVGTAALMRSLMSEEPQLNRFTALNDMFHKGTNSKHAEGLAMDFTVRDPAQSAAVSERLSRKLAQMGVDARVINEYLNPSAGATGPHIHVQFNSVGASQQYAGMTGASAALGANGRSSTSTSTSETTIGSIVVNTQATNAQGIASDLGNAMRAEAKKRSLALSANGGAN